MNAPIGLLAAAWLHGHQAVAEMSALAPDLRIGLGVATLGTPFLEAARAAADLLGDELETRTRALLPALESFDEHMRPRRWGEAVLKVHLLIGAGDDLTRLTGGHWGQSMTDLAQRAPGQGLVAPLEETLLDLVKDEQEQSRLGLFGRRIIGEATAQAQRVATRDPGLFSALLGVEPGSEEEMSATTQLIADLGEGAAQRLMALGLQP